MFGVSYKAIQKARQMAKRTRAAVACARCKSAKLRCSDFRPCKQCSKLRMDCCATQNRTHTTEDTAMLAQSERLRTLENFSNIQQSFRIAANTYHSIDRDNSLILPDGSRQLILASFDQDAMNRSKSVQGRPSGINLSNQSTSSNQEQELQFQFGMPRASLAAPAFLSNLQVVSSPSLPHAVAALLCDLTRPVPHPPPPPDALTLLLSMACAAQPPAFPRQQPL